MLKQQQPTWICATCFPQASSPTFIDSLRKGLHAMTSSPSNPIPDGILVPVPSSSDNSSASNPTSTPTPPFEPEMPEVKSWWRSKVLWVNVLTLIVGILNQVQDSPLFDKEVVQSALVYILAAANTLLRLFAATTILTIRGRPAVEYLRKP